MRITNVCLISLYTRVGVLTLLRSDLGIYKNLAEEATVLPVSTMANLKDLTLSSCSNLDSSTASYTFALKAVTGDDTDSYGIKKIILYSDTAMNLAGWKVKFYSLEQTAYVDCDSDVTKAPSDTKLTNITIVCVANARTKSIKIIPPTSGLKKLCEVVIAGLPSFKYACNTGWKSTTGKQPCTPCSSGTFGESANVCTPCIAGKFSKYTAFAPILTCTDCLAGTYSAKTASVCIDCPKGSVSASAGASECAKCTIGQYQPNIKKTACLDCDVGTYAGAKGASECTKCEVGKFVNDQKASTCKSCAKGTYNGVLGKTSCKECDPGTYAENTEMSACKPCDQGSIATSKGASACTKCKAGEYQAITGRTTCDKCKVGTYAKTTGSATCTPCPKGQFAQAIGSIGCTKCSAGGYVDATGSTSCKVCSEGQFQAELGQESCKKCPDGSTSGRGASSCSACQKGEYLNSKTMKCANCLPGTYTDQEGRTSCTQTGINQYQDQEKSTTFKTCIAGQVAPSKGRIRCDLCDRGTYRTVDDSLCKPCLAGKYADQKGSGECKKCPMGEYSEARAISCYLCAIGHYQDEAGKGSCKSCNPGYFASTTGLKLCKKCPADTYSSEKGSFTCTSCSYGTFQPVPGNTNCIACPKRAAYQPVSCPPVIPKCPSLTYSNQYGNWSWPEEDPPDNAKDAVLVFVDCGYKLGGEDGYGKVSRKCVTWKEGKEQKSSWTDASYPKCGTAESELIYKIKEQLKEEMAALKKQQEQAAAGVTVTLSPEVSQNILTGLTKVTKGKDIGAADSANVVSALATVSKSVDLTNKENQKNMLAAINSFADKDPAFIADSGGDTTSQAVSVVENIGAGILAAAAKAGGDSDDPPEPIKTKTMTIASTPINEKSKNEVTSLSFGEDDDDDDADEAKKEPTEPPAQVTEAKEIIVAPVAEDEPVPATMDPLEKAKAMAAAASKPVVIKQPKKIVKVAMPPLGNLIKKNEDGSEPAGLICVVFKTANLFPTNDTEEKSTTGAPKVKESVASNVVLLALGTEVIENIDPPLKLNFTKEEPTTMDESTETVNYKCVYYIAAVKKWSSEGCLTLKANKSFGGMVECACNHMTSFAVLMSVEPIPDNLAKIQSLITNPLIGLSLLSLCLMVGMILPIKSLRSTRSMKIHLSLAGSQMFAISVFLLTNFITPESPYPMCEILAMLIHYAYLVVFMWTIVESVIMYISLVQVFGGHISKYMIKFNLFCWSVPLLSPITSYFLTDTDLLMDDKCVVKESISKYSFILPIGVVLLINLYIFFALLKVILKAKSPDKSATENAMKQLKAVASISCLLGLGWLVAFFGYGPLAPYCQFAFIIINGGQGVLMFIFYCLLNDQFIDEWRKKLGMERKIRTKATSSSVATRDQTKVSTVQAPNITQAAVTQAAPKPAPAASKPKKEEPTKDVVYENNMADNIYDTLDDPDIGSMNPATITRI